MAFIDAGFDGTVDEVQFAKLLNRYAIVGADDFKASNVAGADRTLSIADGTALGPGTLNVGEDFSPIQFDAVTSGTTRWDLVVLRRDWQPPGGNTSIVIIKGGATKVLPTAGTSTTSWNRRPGIIDDQPLYLQQVNAGSTSLGTRVDLRVWAGVGGAEAADPLALTYLAQPGAAVKIGNTVYRNELQGNGVWGWSGTLVKSFGYNKTIGVQTVNATSYISDVSIPDPGAPYLLTASVFVEGSSSSRWDMSLRVDDESGQISYANGDSGQQTWALTGLTTTPLVGTHTVRLAARLRTGNSPLVVGNDLGRLRVQVSPA